MHRSKQMPRLNESLILAKTGYTFLFTCDSDKGHVLMYLQFILGILFVSISVYSF